MFRSEIVDQTPGNIWVPPGGIGIGQADDELFTSGVGACIEVSIFDIKSRVGYMAHVFSTYGSQQATFADLEQLLQTQARNYAQLLSWITGGSSEADPSPRIMPSNLLRNRAIAKLGSFGLFPGVNLSVEWNNDEEALVSASLDCSTGVHKIAKRPVIAKTA